MHDHVVSYDDKRGCMDSICSSKHELILRLIERINYKYVSRLANLDDFIDTATYHGVGHVHQVWTETREGGNTLKI